MTPNNMTKFKDQAQSRALTVLSSNPTEKRIDSELLMTSSSDKSTLM